ncbi:XRE family transcriptional regulator [Clostridium minihomine]|uniref:XRE family transcriptional regulator n=1 Tax=Clostridium minihomine TaxID=2045012 RepID=UPI000C757C54|nr:XRE family transcriptional regulator [Clostridium minihomine]
MRMDEPIKILCIKTDLTMTEIAKRLNKTPQAFSQKVKRGTFSIDDLDQVAMVTDCKLECSFVLPNGERIQIQ